MSFSFADDGGIDVADVALPPAGAGFHGFNGDSDSVGNLLLEQAQCFLTDDLACDLTLCLRGNHIFIVERFTGRQQIKNILHQLIDAVAGAGAHGDNFVKDTLVGIFVDDRQNLGFFHLIDLVYDNDNRSLYFFKKFDDGLVFVRQLLAGLNKPQNDIHFLQGSLGCFDHIGSQFGTALMDAGRIQEDDLSLFTGIDGANLGPSRLRLIGCDRDLLADHAVHQRGFADIGTADDGRKTRFFDCAADSCFIGFISVCCFVHF